MALSISGWLDAHPEDHSCPLLAAHSHLMELHFDRYTEWSAGNQIHKPAADHGSQAEATWLDMKQFAALASALHLLCAGSSPSEVACQRLPQQFCWALHGAFCRSRVCCLLHVLPHQHIRDKHLCVSVFAACAYTQGMLERGRWHQQPAAAVSSHE